MPTRETPFNKRLIALRLKKGFSQIELSRRAEVPQPNLSALERGSRKAINMSAGTAIRLANALDCSLDELLLGRV